MSPPPAAEPRPLGDRLLLGPGPSNPYPEVATALAWPMLGHLDPDFLAVLDETAERLRAVFHSSHPLTFPVSGTGSAGMEAAFVNVVDPGDVVVVGVNGLFGERMCEVATRCGAEVVRVEAPWGSPLDPQAVLDAHPEPSVIAVVHAETSTGVRNDVACLGSGAGDALVLVDCVTSLGGVPVEVDGWGVDIAYSATQKCLGAPPGLAPISVGPRALERLVDRPRSWYLDLHLLARYVSGGATRAYHHTAPVTMVLALHAALGALLAEGLDAAWTRHSDCGAALVAGLEERGLAPVADVEHRLPQLCAVRVPDGRLPPGRDEAGVRRRLVEHHGIEIGGGLGPMVGKVWRIGLMGHGARLRNVEALLGALDEELAV